LPEEENTIKVSHFQSPFSLVILDHPFPTSTKISTEHCSRSVCEMAYMGRVGKLSWDVQKQELKNMFG